MITKIRTDFQNTMRAGGIIIGALVILNMIVYLGGIPSGYNYFGFEASPISSLWWQTIVTIILTGLATYVATFLSKFYFKMGDGAVDPSEQKKTDNNGLITFIVCFSLLLTSNLFGEKVFIGAAVVLGCLILIAFFAGPSLMRIIRRGASDGDAAGEKFKEESVAPPPKKGGGKKRPPSKPESSFPAWAWAVVIIIILAFLSRATAPTGNAAGATNGGTTPTNQVGVTPTGTPSLNPAMNQYVSPPGNGTKVIGLRDDMKGGGY